MTIKVTFPNELPDLLEINELHDYWQSIRGDQCVPDRRDFSPVSVKRHLPNLAVIEVHIDTKAFEVRLFGTALMEIFGEDRTGRTQDNLTGKSAEEAVKENALNLWQEVLTKTVREAAPVFFETPRLRTGYRHQTLKGICLPLTNGSSKIAQVLALMYVR